MKVLKMLMRLGESSPAADKASMLLPTAAVLKLENGKTANGSEMATWRRTWVAVYVKEGEKAELVVVGEANVPTRLVEVRMV